MAKSKPQGGKAGKKSGGEPRILVLGNGPSLHYWIERLEEARVAFVHMDSETEGGLPWNDPDLIIETEDLRYQEPVPHSHDDDDFEDDEDGPLHGNGNGHGHSHGHAHGHAHLEVLAPEGGAILVPCYSSSPTALASIYGESAPQVIGYTLFPRPEEAAGLGIIEVARALQTSDASWETALGRLRTMGFSPEPVGDAPAGVFGRSLAMLINEAALAFSEGIGSMQDIDMAMQLGVNYPKGLFEWADEIGPDLILDMLEGLYDHYLDDRYRPAPLLRHVVAAGMKFEEL